MTDGSSSPLVDSTSGQSNGYGTSSRASSRSGSVTVSVSPSVWAVVWLMVVQMLERVAFFVITNDIAIYVGAYMDLRISGTLSLSAITILTLGTMRLLTPIYGLLSDAKFGMFNILVSCFSTYCIGVFLICASAYTLHASNDPETLPQCLYYPGLAVIVLVSAPGIRATLVPFMLEQLTDGGHQRNRHLTAFVSWSYFAINVGAGSGILLGGYLQSLPAGFTDFKVADHNAFPGFFWRYLLALSSLCLALVILIIRRNKFRRSRPSNFYRPNIKAILQAAFCKKVQRQHFNIETLRWYEQEAANEAQRRDKKRKEDIRRIAETLPLMCVLILYFTIQSQIESTFVDQGLHLNYGKLADLPIPPADLTYGFDPLAVIVTVPVMLFCVKSLYERIAKSTLYSVIMPRIRWGMILAFLSCGLATFIESYRVSCGGLPKLRHYRMNEFNISVCFSDIPIYTQVPQYVLMGTSEALTIVGFKEFVLSSSPHQFRSTMFGMVEFVTGLGRYIGVILLALIWEIDPKAFYPSLIASGKTIECDMDKEIESTPYVYFMILTCLITVNLVFYMIFETRFRKFVRIVPLPRKRNGTK